MYKKGQNMQSGCFQGRNRKRKFFAGFFCIISVFLAVKYTGVAQAADKQPVLRNRVYKFRYISAKDAKERLVSMGIGRNINELPHNSLIVESGNPGDLVKASSLLGLIDSEQPFVIKTILTSPDIQKLPRNDEIAAELGDIIIGTFKEPPTDTTKPSAILDIHGSDLIAIAPEPLFDRIAETIHKMLAPPTQPKSAEPKEPEKLTEPNLVPVPVPPTTGGAFELTEEEVLDVLQETIDKQEAPDVPVDDRVKAEEKKEDIFGDELLEALAEAEKAAQQGLAEAPKAAPEKPAEQIIREGEELRPVEEPPKVVPPRQADDSAPAPTEAERIGISKEDLAAIVQAEVAKLLKVRATPPPGVLAVEESEPNVVPLKAPGKKQQIAEGAKATEEQPAEPGERLDEQPRDEYLDQLAIPEAEGEIDLTITLPEKVEIVALLEMVGKLLGLNYIYDENQVKGDVMLKVHDGKIKVKDAYALLESVLKFRGFVMTRRGQLVTIVPQAQALDYDPTFRTSPKDIQPGDVIVTSIFHLKHVDTASAETLLKSMKLGTIINSIPETGTLIVTGYAYRMGRIEELLKMIDIPGKPRKFQFRQLQHTLAAEVLPKIQTLAEQLGTVSVSISVSTTAAAAPAKPLTAAQRRTAARRPTPARPTTTTKKAEAAAKQAVYLDVDERTNRILMIGLVEDIDIVNQLIDTLDIETPDLRVIKEYEIQHVDATEIVNTLGELGVVAATTTRGTSQRQPTITKAPAGRTPARSTTTTSRTGGAAFGEEEPQISILEATNSLLINALPAQHAIIALVIAHVDRELEEATLPYVIYPLENQDPQELADVLSKLIEKTARVKAAAAKDAKVQTRPTAATTPSKLQEEITIVPDIKSYSLIVYASKKNQQWISSLIKKLDEYRPQVLLDVTLVEITKEDIFDLDIDATLLTGLPQFSLVSTTGADLKDNSVTAFYKDEEIDTLLTALQKKGYGRILARPKLLVNDNEEGTIKTEKQTSVAQVQTQYLQTGTGQVPQYSPQTSVTFESYTAGITLTITPHISKGDQLGLTITLTRSDFRDRDPTSIGAGTETEKATYPTPPDLLTSDVTTKVTVPDKSTIILGGLEKITQIKGGTKVPLLGDIPIVGGLFRTISNKDEQSRLYVFVKANIIRPGEEITEESDIVKSSQKNRATFEKYETEMQEYEDWPGIKPEPMDPMHILEADEPRRQ